MSSVRIRQISSDINLRRLDLLQKLANQFNILLTDRQLGNGSRPIKWQIEGDTVKLLQLAVEHLPNLLDKHHFILTNPVADTAQVVNAFQRRGAQIEGKLTDNKRALAAAKVSSER